LSPEAGEIWLAAAGDERRRLVFIISDARFHRLAERAVVAPVLAGMPASPRPWHVSVGDRAVAVNQLGTTAIERLVEVAERPGSEVLRQVRLAVREITN